MLEKFKLIKRQSVFKGRIIEFVQDQVELPNGKEATREVVLHGGAAAILPITDEGKILLVRQYRHPIERFTLEIPAGCLETGEDPLDCATRELEEETGYKSNRLKYMFKVHTAVGFCNELIHVYLAENLQRSKQNLDEDEFVDVVPVTLDEAIRMIKQGEITDGKTISAITYYKAI